MLYKFKTPEEYDKFISEHISGDFSTFDMEALIPEVKKLKRGQTYLEIGVKHGKSLAVAFLAARKGVNIVGIDIEDSEERQKLFRRLGLTNYANFIHSDSSTACRIWNRPIDVLFIDGDHSIQGCTTDIRNWAHFVPKNGVILFHDCDETSPGVMEAVKRYYGNKVKLYKTPYKNTSMARVIK